MVKGTYESGLGLCTRCHRRLRVKSTKASHRALCECLLHFSWKCQLSSNKKIFLVTFSPQVRLIYAQVIISSLFFFFFKLVCVSRNVCLKYDLFTYYSAMIDVYLFHISFLFPLMNGISNFMHYKLRMNQLIPQSVKTNEKNSFEMTWLSNSVKERSLHKFSMKFKSQSRLSSPNDFLLNSACLSVVRSSY